MIAGSIVLGFGRTAFYAFNGRLRSALAAAAERGPPVGGDPRRVPARVRAVRPRRGDRRATRDSPSSSANGARTRSRCTATTTRRRSRTGATPTARTGWRSARDVGLAAASARVDAARGRPGLQVAVTARRMSQLGGTTTAGDAGRALALAARPGRLIDGPAIERYEAELARVCGGRARDRLRRGTDRAVRDPARAGRRRGRRGDRPAAHAHRRHERRQVPRREAGLRRLPAWPTTTSIPTRSRRSSGRERARILVQHTFGIPGDMEALLAIAAEHDLPLIEDCVHALGATWRGRPVGGIGTAGLLQHGGDEDHLDHDGRRRRDERRAARRGRARVPARVPAARALADREAAGQAGGVLRAHRAPRPHPRAAGLRGARRTPAAARADHRGGARRRTAGALRGAARCGPGRDRAAAARPARREPRASPPRRGRRTPPRSAPMGFVRAGRRRTTPSPPGCATRCAWPTARRPSAR